MSYGKASDFIRTHLQEAVKTYSVWDGSGRLTHTYVTQTDAADGTECMVTQYEYDGTSNRVIKTKESRGIWVSATMDI